MEDNSFLKHPERRTHHRLDVGLDIQLTIDGQALNVTTGNISCGGLFLPIKRTTIKEKTNLEMFLHIPGNQKPVKLWGEVARVQGGVNGHSSENGVAVKFNGLYDDNILAIEKFIKSKVH